MNISVPKLLHVYFHKEFHTRREHKAPVGLILRSKHLDSNSEYPNTYSTDYFFTIL